MIKSEIYLKGLFFFFVVLFTALSFPAHAQDIDIIKVQLLITSLEKGFNETGNYSQKCVNSQSKNKCREDAEETVKKMIEDQAVTKIITSLRENNALQDIIKELNLKEDAIRSGLYGEVEKNPAKKIIDVEEINSCVCDMKAFVQVKIKPDFREKLSKKADNSKYYTEPKTNMEFVFVKGGDFDMSVENKGVKVHVDDFYMGKYEVTNAQFMKFRPDHYDKRNKPYSSDKGKHPVIDVTWNDAEDFAKWLSDKGEKFRLPTEAEWEYAARAGTKTKHFWGDKPEDACKYANIRECKKDSTIPAGSLTPNDFGLCDMLGNVWEWVKDEAVKGSPDSDRVMRGGSYKDFAERVTNSVRGQASPNTENTIWGFRLIRENKPSKK